MSDDIQIQLVDNPDLDICASLMLDLRTMSKALRHGIKVEDFIDPHASVLFEAQLRAYKAGRTIFEAKDCVDAFRRCETRGWQSFMAAALRRNAGCMTETYAIEIRHRTLRAKATTVLDEAKASLNKGGTIEELVGAANIALTKLYAEARPARMEMMGDAAVRAIESIKESQKRGESLGVPTGFYELDEMVGGAFPGELVILAARPSVGKTALAMQIALNMAKKNRCVVAFSFEMINEELAMRALSSLSEIPFSDIRHAVVAKSEIETLEAKSTEAIGWPLYLFDDPKMTVDQITSYAQMVHHERQVSAIVIDYLTIMPGTKGSRNKTTNDAISEVTSSLKQLAQVLKVPVFLLSQLNREAAKEGRPKLHHLRDSGSIEQDADQVWMLERDGEDEKQVNLYVEKNRNGTRGVVHLSWQPIFVKFGDREARQMENYEHEFSEYATYEPY